MQVGDRVTRDSIYGEQTGRVISLIPKWGDVCLVQWDGRTNMDCVHIDHLTIVGHYVAPPPDLTHEEASLWFDLMREQTFIDNGWDPADLKGIHG